MAAVTWNPSDSAANISFSNGNRTATSSTNAAKSVRATAAAGGLVYWEVTVSDATGGIGVADLSASLSTYIGADTHGLVYQPSTGSALYNGSVVASLATASAGAVLRCAYNKTSKRFWLQPPSGAWNGNGSADPATGVGGADVSGFASDAYAAATPWANGASDTANFAGPFTYPTPSGYSPYDPAYYQALTPSLFTNSASFFSPAATRGAVALSPPLASNSATFHSPTVSRGAQQLAPSLLSGANTLYTPAVAPGAVVLAPSLFSGAAAFYGMTVRPGVVILLPAQIVGGVTFYAAAVTQASGAQALHPARLDNISRLYAPTASGGVQTLLASLLQNASVVMPPTAANQDRPLRSGTYPLAVKGKPSTIGRSLTGGASAALAAVEPGGRVVASILKGRP